DSLAKQDEKTKVINIGTEVEGSEINIANKEQADRTLSGVKAGVLSAESTEVVNGSQLFATNKNVTTVSTNLDSVSQNTSSYFGGGADVLVGNLPTYVVGGQSYHDVGSAFSGVDTSLTDLHNELSKNSNELTQTIEQNALLWNDDAHAFVARHVKNKEKDGQVIAEQENSKLKFLLDGEISKGSTEAITGNQLYSMNQTFATYFGGGAGYDKDGQWKAPSFVIKKVDSEGKESEESYKSVAEALSDISSSVTNVHNDVTNVVSDSLAKQDDDTKVINIGTEVEGSEINIANKDKGDRILSGVKAATKDNEAVNKGQLDESLKDLSNNLQSDESAVVHYDKKDGDNGSIDYTSVTLGKGKGSTPVGLHNVADGTIGENSHDAVNGGQISKVSQDIAQYLGGGTSFKEGTFTGPTYKISSVDAKGEVVEKSYNDVGSAFSGIDTNFKNVNSNLTNKFNELTENITNITQEVQGDALLWNEDAEAFVATHGEKESKSKITSLAAGSIVSGSSDAVNGSQLFDLQKQFAGYFGGGAGYNEKGEWQDPDFQIQTFSNDGTKGDKKSSNNVAGAFNDINDSMSTINARIKEVSEGVAQDSLSWSKAEGAFVALHGEKDGEKTHSKITSLANGDITASSSDAVAGNQLYALGNSVAKSLGGEASYAGGAWMAPSFKVKTVNEDGAKVEEKEYDTVSAALAGVGTSFENLQKEFTQNNTEITENIKQNALLWSDSEKAFVATHGEGDEKGNGKIKFLSNGEVSANSSDAVNGSQLFDTNKTVATYLGGGAEYKEGQWSAPSFKVKIVKEDGSAVEEQSYDDVASAFAGVGDSFTNIHKELQNEINKVVGDSLVKQDDATKVIKIGGEKEGSAITISNMNGDTRSLSGVKAGTLSEGSTEAVNGSQLYSLHQTLAMYLGGGASYEGGEWRAPEFKVAQFNTDGLSSEKKIYHDVAGAFDGVSEGMTSINDRIHDVEKNVATNGLNWNEEEGAYDAKHDGNSSKITNVLDGKIEEGSQEVVNGGQLWSTNERVKEVEDKVDTIDQHVKDIEVAVTDGVVNYDKDSDGKKTNSITLVGGNDSEPVMIDNVADGKIETGSQQAINGGQLHDYTEEQMKIVLEDANKYTDEKVSSFVNDAVNESKSYTDMKFETLNYAIEDVRKEARQAAAIGLAVSNLRYYDIPGSLSVSFGSGLWRSQSAFALGAGYTSEDGNIRSNVSVTSAGGHWGIGAGITLRLR
uniref:Vomp family autotransporter n=2 Tax=unclassified Bartonella TaxID=2645622 RepID=UPI0035D0E242